MYGVETYAAVRQFVFVEGRSKREAARVFGLGRDTVDKMCRFSVPPGYQRETPPARPNLDPFCSHHRRMSVIKVIGTYGRLM